MEELKSSERKFYEWLIKNPDCQGLKNYEIAEMIGKTPATVGRMIAALEQKGYIRCDVTRTLEWEKKIVIL